MASPVNAVFCALIATAFWICSAMLWPGTSCRVCSRSARVPSSAGRYTCRDAAGLSLDRIFPDRRCRHWRALHWPCWIFAFVARAGERGRTGAAIPPWAFAAAAILALVPTSAILPKFSGDAVQFAEPIFDHAKIAIIDAMTRLACRRSIRSLASSARRAASPIIISGISAPPRSRWSSPQAAGKPTSARLGLPLSPPSA